MRGRSEAIESARTRKGRVSMDEHGYPCTDHATACADRNRGCKNTGLISTCFLTEETCRRWASDAKEQIARRKK